MSLPFSPWTIPLLEVEEIELEATGTVGIFHKNLLNLLIDMATSHLTLRHLV